MAEAYDLLEDAEKRAADDQLGASYKAGQEFQPSLDWAGSRPERSVHTQSFQYGDGQDHIAFFDSLLRGMGRGQGTGQQSSHEAVDMHGQDQRAKCRLISRTPTKEQRARCNCNCGCRWSVAMAVRA